MASGQSLINMFLRDFESDVMLTNQSRRCVSQGSGVFVSKPRQFPYLRAKFSSKMHHCPHVLGVYSQGPWDQPPGEPILSAESEARGTLSLSSPYRVSVNENVP